MRSYPIFLNLEGRRCLVAGGGRVGYAKAKTLCAAGGKVTVVSPTFVEAFAALEDVVRISRPFEPADLDDAFIGIAATNDCGVNRGFAQACRLRGVLCNVVDAPEWCDFHVPSILERGALTIAVSTGGASPALAKRLRSELEELMPEVYEAYTAFLDVARREAQARVGRRDVREALATRLASREGFEQFCRLTEAERQAWLVEALTQAATEGV